MPTTLTARIRKIRTRSRLVIHQPSPMTHHQHLRQVEVTTGRDVVEILKGRGSSSMVAVMAPVVTTPTDPPTTAAWPATLFLLVSRKSIEVLPWWVRWVLRRVYAHYGWAASCEGGDNYCSIEYQGWCFNREVAEAVCIERPGWSFTEIPLSSLLPEATCQFHAHEFPSSPANRHFYRNRNLAIVATHQQDLQDLYNELRKVNRVLGSSA